MSCFRLSSAVRSRAASPPCLAQDEGASKADIPPWEDAEASSSDDEGGENDPPTKQ